MNIGAASIFIVILVLGLFVNKYVLSVLGFKYPTIFQVNTFLTHNISGNILFFSPPGSFSPLISPLPHQGWQTLCGLLLYKILTVASKSNFKVKNLKRSKDELGSLFQIAPIFQGDPKLLFR